MMNIKKDFNKMSTMLIPIAVAINFIAGSLAHTLKLPVYLDMIGTFLMSMIGGPWIGAATGALSIILKSLTDPTELPYALLAAAIGFVAGILARKGMFSNVTKTIISGLIAALISVVVVIVIRVSFFGGFSTAGASNMVAGLMALGLPFWPAQFIGQMISEIPDKLISVIIPLTVIKSMSNRYLIKFPNGRMFMKDTKKRVSRERKVN